MTSQFRMFLLSCAFAVVGAQHVTARSVEVFGGFSLTNMKPESFNQALMKGWNSSVTVYPTSRLGITGDFAGFYTTVNPVSTNSSGSSTSLPGASIRHYSFMAGPQIRLFHFARVETSFRALAGAAYGYLPDPTPVGVTYNPLDETTFAALIGTNFDVNVSRRIALRLSPGLYLTQFNGETQKNFRFSVGPVFRFGSGE